MNCEISLIFGVAGKVFGEKQYVCGLRRYLSVMGLSVVVGKYGRIVLPKKVRDKYGVREGFKFIVTDLDGQICLVPVNRYEKPTEALYGAVKVEKPVDEPKRVAREYIRKKC